MSEESSRGKVATGKSHVFKPEDRVSGLPDSILSQILSFLPTKLAAATSVLSTRWRYLFLDVPKIDIDESMILNPDLNREEDIDENDDKLNLEEHFTCFIRNGLSSHKSPIKEFRVRLLKQNHGKMQLVKAWISSPLCRNVEVVDVSVRRAWESKNLEDMPCEIFNYKPLVELKLHGRFVLRVPKSELSWLPNLKVLSFCGDPDLFKCLRSKRAFRVVGDNTGWDIGMSCPLLEELSFSYVHFSDVGLVNISIPSLKMLVWVAIDDGDRVVLSAPNLEYLKYDYFLSPVIDSTCKMKQLVRADLHFRFKNEPLDDEADKLHRFINEVHNVEFLRIYAYSLEFQGVTDDSLCDFLNLTHLEVVECRDDNWDLLERLLKSALNLEMLVCDMENDEVDPDMELDYSLYDKPRCLDRHLMKVEIRNYIDSNYDFQLGRYFLNHGSVLKEMTFRLHKGEHSKKWRSSERKKLSKIWKCSKNCKVVFKTFS
ncbi:hypothetical protein OROGR_004183 [Orobanche gracilis]